MESLLAGGCNLIARSQNQLRQERLIRQEFNRKSL